MTLKERQQAIENRKQAIIKIVEYGFCTHYPGYVCNKDWTSPGICNKCISSWLNRTGNKPEKILEEVRNA